MRRFALKTPWAGLLLGHKGPNPYTPQDYKDALVRLSLRGTEISRSKRPNGIGGQEIAVTIRWDDGTESVWALGQLRPAEKADYDKGRKRLIEFYLESITEVQP